MLALVDEWGNPAPGTKGTEWFGFACVLLRNEQVDIMKKLYQDICNCLGSDSDRPLHFRNLNGNSKYHITRVLSATNIKISIVAVRINEITSEKLRQKGWAYRYYMKEMVRVATHFASDNNEKACVIFDSHKYLQDLEDYIWQKLRYNHFYRKRKVTERILFDKLQEVRAVDSGSEPLLSFADCVAHACHLAFNPDSRWKLTNPTCLDLLTDCVWKGPSYLKMENPRLFGALIEPEGIPVRMISNLPLAIRKCWQSK
ncbi:MAG: hypothetical protein MUO89_02040 [Dehalococcoidia bacterium]|nr:hypothetical protein [Dehalococcoidia bacterium]